MTSIIGKVVGRLYVPDRQNKAAAAKSYHRDRFNPEFLFGKEVTLIEVRGYTDHEFDKKANQRIIAFKQGGAGYRGIILGPKLNVDGTVNRGVIGIGTQSDIIDFQVDPNAKKVKGHATLIFDNPSDFAEITGEWGGTKLTS